MIGKRSSQVPLFDVGNVFSLELDPTSFHGQLAQASNRLFADADFAAFYHERVGRPSVPPSQLALLMLLQHESGVSDEEATQRSAFDLRWCAVLGKQAGVPLCAKSTLQLFRAHYILHPAVAAIFASSIREAKRSGLLRGKTLRVATDTKPMRGRGAVKDTYNLLATGIAQLARALSRQAGQEADAFLQNQGLERYTQASLKGSADMDWSDEAARERFLTQIVADARRLLCLATSPEDRVRSAASLLEQLLLQDVEVKTSPEGGEHAHIKEGVTPGRIPSVTDPEVRHGRKSASKRFNGHKAAIVVEEQSQVILSMDVLAGDAPDACGVLSLVEQAEQNADLPVEETAGDCAYGSATTRKEFAEADRDLLAKVPAEHQREGMFPKSAFTISPSNDQVTCPAGQTTTRFTSDPDGGKTFSFGAACADCPFRAVCTKAAGGRTLRVHPQEAMLAAARAYQASPQGRARLRKRVVVEHRLARLGQLGIGQARYTGRTKSRFQLMMACTLANLRRIWNAEAARETHSPSKQPDYRAERDAQAPLGRLGSVLRVVSTLFRRINRSTALLILRGVQPAR